MFEWASTRTKLDTSVLHYSYLFCSPAVFSKHNLLASTQNPLSWLVEWTKPFWTSGLKLLLICKATWLSKTFMSFRHSATQSTNRQSLKSSFLFSAKNQPPYWYLVPLHWNNLTGPTCVTLSNKNVLTCKELMKQHACISKLLQWDATVFEFLRDVAPKTIQATISG